MNKPIKELIQRLKEPDYQYYGCELCKSEADLAISALEKQIPKKPSFIDSEIFECSNCRWKRSISNIHFCPTCGQAIDWRNEDE